MSFPTYNLGPSSALAVGDVGWLIGGRSPSFFNPENDDGQFPNWCTGNLAAEVAAFHMPTAPATFAGRSSGDGWSKIRMLLPGRAPYVADIHPQTGAVDATFRVYATATSQYPNGDRHRSATLVSPGTVDLGTISERALDVELESPNAAPVSWTMTVRALPVPVQFKGTPPRLMAPGMALPFTVGVDGDTTINAHVVNAAGESIRHLGQMHAASEDQTLYWDGRDAHARDVPDGTYRIVADSADPSGHRSSVAHEVTVDSTPPRIDISTRPVRPRQPLSFSITEPTSALFSRAVSWNGRSADRLMNWRPDGVGMLRPANGRFDVGVHRLRVTARNTLGQEATRTANVRVSGAPLSKPKLRVRRGSIQVAALSGVSGRKQIAVLRGKRIVGRCAKNGAAGKRFTCRAAVAKSARGQRVRVRITARSAQTGKSHVLTRIVRAR